MSEMTATVNTEVQAGTDSGPSDWSSYNQAVSAANQENAPASAPPEPVVTPPSALNQSVVEATPSGIPAPVQPTATATATPEIPEKFKGADGKLDQEKLLKSYLTMEPQFKRLQSQTQPAQAQAQANPNPVPTNVPLSPFEARVAQDLITQGLPEQYAIAQSRVMVSLMEAKHKADTAATFSRVALFEQTLQEQARRSELDNLAKNPATAWVMEPQGQAQLVKVREENPWINESPEPWKTAALFVLGQKQLGGGPVITPTPQAVTAPNAPVMASPRSEPVKLNTQEDVKAYVSKLNPEQEAEFWRRQGFTWKDNTFYRK